AGAGAAAVAGSVGVPTVNNHTWAYVGSSATVNAGGNVRVAARDDTGVTLVAGAAALGLGGVGVGGSVAVTTITKETLAYVADNATVNARGNNPTGVAALDGTVAANFPTRTVRGLSVQARSSEDLLNVVVAGAGGYAAGIAGAVSVEVVR